MADPQAETWLMSDDECENCEWWQGAVRSSEAARSATIAHLAKAEARNEALLQALKEFLENDGGESSKCYDASKYVAARGKLRALLDSGSASQEAKTPGGENAS